LRALRIFFVNSAVKGFPAAGLAWLPTRALGKAFDRKGREGKSAEDAENGKGRFSLRALRLSSAKSAVKGFPAAGLAWLPTMALGKAFDRKGREGKSAEDAENGKGRFSLRALRIFFLNSAVKGFFLAARDSCLPSA
jgi:hypothetical protein